MTFKWNTLLIHTSVSIEEMEWKEGFFIPFHSNEPKGTLLEIATDFLKYHNETEQDRIGKKTITAYLVFP